MTAETGFLRISQRAASSRVLGPGTRAVVWVQGCPLRCRDCIAPETLPFDGGDLVPVAELAAWIGELAGIDGVTLSGGEPMAQAGELARLVDLVRAHRDLSVLSYTGYPLRWLRTSGSAQQRALLARLDVLIDGPYRPELHADLLWRGSRNQRIHHLTRRHAPVADGDGTGAGLEFEVRQDRSLRWTGVPAVPGFRATFEAELAARGVRLHVEG
jgi:anaerobic ribonucleoside-triphosphate reductase activating protein